MRPRYSCLLLALAVPGATLAQTAPGTPDKQFAGYLATRTSRPHVVVGVQAALPVYWREMDRVDQTVDWGYLNPVVGIRLTAHWAAQVSASVDGFGRSYNIIPGVNAPAGPGQPAGSGHTSGIFTAVPVQVRYHPNKVLAPQWAFEVFAGLTPQWQRYETNETTARPGQPFSEMTVRTRTTDVYATAGLASVWGVGPGAEVLVEAALNRRCHTSGAANYASALVPTAGLGFRYRFGGLPRRTSYL